MRVLYSPLCWMLFASLALWGYVVWSRILGNSSRAPKEERRTKEVLASRTAWCVAGAYLLAWTIFAFVSTPIGSQLLRQSLVQDPSGKALFAPEYILVASMGYLATDDPATNVLNDGTALRVAAAARWHREHPDAFVVMQGSSGASEPEDHQARLMANAAASLGVPDEKILLEPLSRTTREHAENLSEFPGITPETPIGVVTSDWHTRRTVGEFRSAFKHVSVRPAHQREIERLRFAHLLPRERDLYASSLYVREWLAILYYRFTSE